MDKLDKITCIIIINDVQTKDSIINTNLIQINTKTNVFNYSFYITSHWHYKAHGGGLAVSRWKALLNIFVFAIFSLLKYFQIIIVKCRICFSNVIYKVGYYLSPISYKVLVYFVYKYFKINFVCIDVDNHLAYIKKM
jgi:hypothetical protein